jgi:defect in organelle trafficking protein DotA
MRRWLLLALILFPIAALASSTSGGIFSVAPTDKSMEYLGMTLGNIPGTPIQTDKSSTISALIYVFNQVVFVLGILIIVYTTVVGTMHTAQEGEFLGKKWHPVLVPLRAALGVYLLLPSTTGYNWIQITVMWFIVQGVGAANALWKQVIVYNQTHISVTSNSRNVSLLNVGGSVDGVFNANVCMVVLNQNPTAMTQLEEPISVYRWGNTIQWGRLSHAGQEQPLCGSVTLPTIGSALTSTTTTTSQSQTEALASAVMTIQAVLMSAAEEAVNGGGTNTLGANAFTTAANLLQTTANNLSITMDSLDTINEQAIKNGWIHAGSYYFQLVNNTGAMGNISVNLATSGANQTEFTNLLGNTLSSTLLGTINSDVASYTQTTNNNISTPPPSGKLKLSPSSANSNVNSILGSIFGSLMDNLVNSINNQITTGKSGTQDPMIAMATFGSNLTVAVELAFWGSLALIFGVWLLSSILHCMNPLGPSMDFLLAMALPITITILSLLYMAGILLGLYIPLIPYLVFTFCAIGWMLLVIEALLGSSLIALTLVIPSEDEIGKAGHAIIILLGLFLRPALMILGFIFAIQLLTVAIKMLNFGFWETMVSSTGGSASFGIFGMVAVLMIYTTIATTLTHECFSLIYVLPNKILRWMGGGHEGDDDAMGKVKELKGSSEKGAAIGKSAMGGVLTKFSPKK